MSKMEVAEDNEPSLSKVDVVLTFTLEVSFTLVYQSLAKNGFFLVTPGFQLIVNLERKGGAVYFSYNYKSLR